MQSWTIGKRLTTGFSVLLIVILVLGGVTFFEMASIQAKVDTMAANDLPTLANTESIRYQAALLRVTNFKHAMYTDAGLKEGLDKQAQEEEAALAGVVQKCEKQLQRGEDRAVFARIPALLDAYRAETRKLREASTANKATEVQALLLSAGKIGNEFVQAVGALRDLSAKQTTEATRNIAATTTSARWAALGIGAAAILLTLFVAGALTRSISKILRRLVQELNAGSEQTAAAAGQVSASSQSLAEGASEQAASLEETSSSLEEISSMTRRSTDNAQKVNTLSKEAREAAERGAHDMEAMSAAMEAISESSGDIAKIIRTIDEIAFQTNILALNAAVEAARAGEAGMGFAVVAEEVRGLAQRSALAAKETAAKIEGAIGRTAQGVEISSKVAVALGDIVAKAREVDGLAAEVASASREQSEGISQVNTAVFQMDKVTQSNAANAEESAAAAEELNAQAEVMKSSVAELLRLVGGHGQTTIEDRSGTEPGNRPSARSQMRRTEPGPVHRTIPGSAPSRIEPRRSGAATSDNRSEIPLEGAFKDF